MSGAISNSEILKHTGRMAAVLLCAVLAFLPSPVNAAHDSLQAASAAGNASLGQAGGVGGLVVVVESRVQEPFVVKSYQVMLNGKIILEKKEGETAAATAAFSYDSFPSGRYKVKARAIYTGSGYGVFDYHEKYTYPAEGEFELEIKEGRIITLKVMCDDREGFLKDLESRPYISFETGSYTAPVTVATDVLQETVDKALENRSVGHGNGRYITGLSVEKADGGVKVHVTGDGTFDRYESFRLNDPERIIVDIFGVKELVEKDTLSVEGGILRKVRLGQHEDYARVVLDIISKKGREYRVEPSARGVLIFLGGEVTQPGKTVLKARQKYIGGNAITGLSVEEVGQGIRVVIEGKGDLGTYETLYVEKPARIVVDLKGVKEMLVNDGLSVGRLFLERLRVGQHEGYARVVFDLAGQKAVDYKVTSKGSSLLVDLTEKTQGMTP